MPVKRNSGNSRVITDFEIVQEELETLCLKSLLDSMSRDKEYMYIDKLLTYADVPTFGKHKANSEDKDGDEVYSEDSLNKRAKANYLFYYKPEQIIQIEKRNRREKHFFCETKQSNISLPSAFYSFLGTSQPRDGASDLNSGKYRTYLVNSCIGDAFDEESTNDLFSKLGRDRLAKKVEISDAAIYTNMGLTTGVHGIGTKADNLFHALRGNAFAKDKVCILVEKSAGEEIEYKIYVMFYRNPKYYQLRRMPIPVSVVDAFTEKEEEKFVESRTGQRRWRNALAELALVREDGEEVDYVVCPFSMVEVKYPAEETLLRASHIKAYAKCKKDNKIDEAEAYDPDNGFLVTANVDALFDKYFLSVDPDTNTIVKSKQLSEELIKALNIQTVIGSEYITEGKKKYLRVHYEEFKRKEEKRD